MGDYRRNIKVIKWKPNASSKGDFDCTEEPTKIGNFLTQSICLTKDEKYLFF